MLLDRGAAVATASVYAPQLSALAEMVDLGTHILCNAMPTGMDVRTEHLVVIGILGKQVVAMLDGITVLLQQCCGLASHGLLRQMWEAELSLAWLLTSDTEERVASFWVSHLLWRRAMWEQELPKSGYHQEHGHVPTGSRPEEQVRAEIADLDRELSMPNLAATKAKFKDGTRSFWANPSGVSNRRQMAQRLNREAEYLQVYPILSASAHAEDPSGHLRIGPGEVLRPIRESQHFGAVLPLAGVVAFRAYGSLLARYLPSEKNVLDGRGFDALAATFGSPEDRATDSGRGTKTP